MMNDRDRRAFAYEALCATEKLIWSQDTFRALLPARYRRATLTDLPEARRTALAAWLDNPASPWALVLSGPPGRGKTYAAAAVGWERARCMKAVLFANWPAWVEASKKAMNGHTEPPDLAGFDGLLVLDDVGAGRLTEYAAGLFALVVEGREANVLPTTFTTNASLSDFGVLDGRLGSRLSGAKWLAFAGDDLRPTAVAPTMPVIPPVPASIEALSAEAERQGLTAFDAETFWEFTKSSSHARDLERTDWRRWVGPWHRLLAQFLAEEHPRHE